MKYVKRGYHITCSKCDMEQFVDDLPRDWLCSDDVELCLCPTCAAEFRSMFSDYTASDSNWRTVTISTLCDSDGEYYQ